MEFLSKYTNIVVACIDKYTDNDFTNKLKMFYALKRLSEIMYEENELAKLQKEYSANREIFLSFVDKNVSENGIKLLNYLLPENILDANFVDSEEYYNRFSDLIKYSFGTIKNPSPETFKHIDRAITAREETEWVFRNNNRLIQKAKELRIDEKDKAVFCNALLKSLQTEFKNCDLNDYKKEIEYLFGYFYDDFTEEGFLFLWNHLKKMYDNLTFLSNVYSNCSIEAILQAMRNENLRSVFSDVEYWYDCFNNLEDHHFEEYNAKVLEDARNNP